MRGLRSEQAEQDGSDFVTVLNACQKKYFPAADLHDWPAGYNTIKRLAEDMVKEFRKKAPVQANQTLLTRLQARESRLLANHRGQPGQTRFQIILDECQHPRRDQHPHPLWRVFMTTRTERKQLHSGHRYLSMSIRWNRRTRRMLRTQDPPLRRTLMGRTFQSQTVFVSLKAATSRLQP